MNRLNCVEEYDNVVDFTNMVLNDLASVTDYDFKPKKRILYEVPIRFLTNAEKSLERYIQDASYWHKENDSKTVEELKKPKHYAGRGDSERERIKSAMQCDHVASGDDLSYLY